MAALPPSVTPAHLYGHNIAGSVNTHARPVSITGPEGQSAGVGIFRSQYLLVILTEQDATRLADQIIDVLEGS
jgi:hypothetical protein